MRHLGLPGSLLVGLVIGAVLNGKYASEPLANSVMLILGLELLAVGIWKDCEYFETLVQRCRRLREMNGK